jgi:hypothetical protein
VRTGTAANCNLTRDRTTIEFTLITNTRSPKAFLHWLKETVCVKFSDHFKEAQISTDDKFPALTLTDNETSLKARITVNNLLGLCAAHLIS